MTTTQITLWLVKETEKARLYSRLPPERHPTEEDQVWVPKSVVEHTSKTGDCHIVTLQDWWIERNNL